MDTDKPWFKPKTHGYGATPASWEGWVSVLVFAACVGLLAWFLLARPAMAGEGVDPVRLVIFGVLEAVLVLGLIALAKSKSSEHWGWRWGRKS